ncbi:MAG: TolC family protein [Armatimonadota bacterium]|nr:TolC family protein [Armatimonadota bacterium]
MAKVRITMPKPLACLAALLCILADLASIDLRAYAEQAIPSKLTISDAVTIALKNHPRLKEAESSYLSALSSLRVAGLKTTLDFGSEAALEKYPGSSEVSNRVFGSFGYTTLFGTQARVDLSPFAVGNRQGSIALSVKQPLLRGRGYLSDRYDRWASAKNQVIIRDKQLYQTKQDTILRVVSAYLRAVNAREQVKVQESAVEIAQRVADAARRKAEAGYAAGIEATRAELRVADVKNQLQIQQQAAKSALESLMLAMGVGVGQTPELIDTVPEVLPEIPTLEEALNRALKNRPELVVSDLQIEDQQRLLAIAKDQLRPELNAVAQFNSVSTGEGLISGSTIENGTLVAGLEYRVALDKRALLEEQQTTERNLEVLKLLKQYQLESIAEEVGRAYRTYQSEKTSLEIYTNNLKTAKENLELANRMMEEASGTNRDVLDAQAALTQTEANILSAKTGLYIAILTLKNAMGEDLGAMFK